MESLGSDRYPNCLIQRIVAHKELEQRRGNTNVGYTFEWPTGVGVAKRKIDENPTVFPIGKRINKSGIPYLGQVGSYQRLRIVQNDLTINRRINELYMS